MHCYVCEKSIEAIPAAENFPIYDFKLKVYWNDPAIVTECPHCRALIVWINGTDQDFTSHPRDESLQTVVELPKERFWDTPTIVHCNMAHCRRNEDNTCKRIQIMMKDGVCMHMPSLTREEFAEVIKSV